MAPAWAAARRRPASLLLLLGATAAAAAAAASSAGPLPDAVPQGAWEQFSLLEGIREAGRTCPGGATYPPNPEPLTFECRLWRAAQLHAQDMADQNYFSHISKDKRTPQQRAWAQGISANGENIAAGQAVPQDALTEMLQSTQGHCDILLNPDFKYIGIGLGFNDASDYRFYWTQMFKRELNDTEGVPDTSCYPATTALPTTTVTTSAAPPTATPSTTASVWAATSTDFVAPPPPPSTDETAGGTTTASAGAPTSSEPPTPADGPAATTTAPAYSDAPATSTAPAAAGGGSGAEPPTSPPPPPTSESPAAGTGSVSAPAGGPADPADPADPAAATTTSAAGGASTSGGEPPSEVHTTTAATAPDFVVQGSRTLNAGSASITVDIRLDPDAAVATIRLAGPSNVWFGVALGAQEMFAQPYAIIVDGAGAVQERKLGLYSQGRLLANSLTQVSSADSGGRRSIELSRGLAGATTAHYSFDTAMSALLVMVAYGAGPNLGYHDGHAVGTVMLESVMEATTTTLEAGPTGVPAEATTTTVADLNPTAPPTEAATTTAASTETTDAPGQATTTTTTADGADQGGAPPEATTTTTGPEPTDAPGEATTTTNGAEPTDAPGEASTTTSGLGPTEAPAEATTTEGDPNATEPPREATTTTAEPGPTGAPTEATTTTVADPDPTAPGEATTNTAAGPSPGGAPAEANTTTTVPDPTDAPGEASTTTAGAEPRDAPGEANTTTAGPGATDAPAEATTTVTSSSTTGTLAEASETSTTVAPTYVTHGSSTLSASSIGVDVQLDRQTGLATIRLTGPSAVWFGVAFGAQQMADTPYAIIVDGSGNIEERRLGFYSAGLRLAPSVTQVSVAAAGGQRSVQLTRALAGAGGSYFSFDPAATTLQIMAAYGRGPSLEYHAGTGVATLALVEAAVTTTTGAADATAGESGGDTPTSATERPAETSTTTPTATTTFSTTETDTTTTTTVTTTTTLPADVVTGMLAVNVSTSVEAGDSVTVAEALGNATQAGVSKMAEDILGTTVDATWVEILNVSAVSPATSKFMRRLTAAEAAATHRVYFDVRVPSGSALPLAEALNHSNLTDVSAAVNVELQSLGVNITVQAVDIVANANRPEQEAVSPKPLVTAEALGIVAAVVVALAATCAGLCLLWRARRRARRAGAVEQERKAERHLADSPATGLGWKSASEPALEEAGEECAEVAERHVPQPKCHLAEAPFSPSGCSTPARRGLHDPSSAGLPTLMTSRSFGSSPSKQDGASSDRGSGLSPGRLEIAIVARLAVRAAKDKQLAAEAAGYAAVAFAERLEQSPVASSGAAPGALSARSGRSARSMRSFPSRASLPGDPATPPPRPPLPTSVEGVQRRHPGRIAAGGESDGDDGPAAKPAAAAAPAASPLWSPSGYAAGGYTAGGDSAAASPGLWGVWRPVQGTAASHAPPRPPSPMEGRWQAPLALDQALDDEDEDEAHGSVAPGQGSPCASRRRLAAGRLEAGGPSLQPEAEAQHHVAAREAEGAVPRGAEQAAPASGAAGKQWPEDIWSPSARRSAETVASDALAGPLCGLPLRSCGR